MDTALETGLNVINDLLEQQVPGSIVLLLVFVCLLPYIGLLLKAYWNRRK